jgi:holo-[acyl-carrier protein] synthase
MYIYGIGLDMLDISRVGKLIGNTRFMERVFTPGEREYIAGRGHFSAASAAGIFCAKEAFVKAAGEGLSIPLRDIEVCRDGRGKPFIRLSGKTAEKYAGLSAELSITHTETAAAAVVILFGKPRNGPG